MPVTAVASKASLSFLPAPRRYINISGGISGALLSLVGLGNMNSAPPSGVLASALPTTTMRSVTPPDGSNGNTTAYAGLQRARTAVRAQQSFLTKWQGGSQSKLSLLSALAEKFLPSNLSPLPTQTGKYKIYDNNTLDVMYSDRQGILTWGTFDSSGGKLSYYSGIKTVQDAQPYTYNNFYNPTDSKNVEKSVDDSVSNMISLIQNSALYSGDKIGTSTWISNPNVNVNYKNIPSPYSSTTGDNSGTYEKKNFGSNSLIRFGIPDNYRRQTANSQAPNAIDVINNNFIRSSETDLTKDLSLFYFYDVYNDKFLQFRNTVTGISWSTSVDWEEFSYIGRSDKLFTYKGFSKELSFNFVIYCNSKGELGPNWARLNYLQGLCEPIDYSGDSNFTIPPFVQVTIGNLIYKKPCIISSFGWTIDEDEMWDIDEQLPTRMICNVSLRVLQEDVPQLNSIKFGGGSPLVKSSYVGVSTNSVKQTNLT